MVELISYLSISLMHWVADFLLQTKDMAINKSKSNYWLALHVFYYTLGMAVIGLLVWYLSGSLLLGITWTLLNGLLHFVVDYCTSRWTSKLYAEQAFYGFPSFFSVIGLDQFIHHFCLFTTFFYFAFYV